MKCLSQTANYEGIFNKTWLRCSIRTFFFVGAFIFFAMGQVAAGLVVAGIYSLVNLYFLEEYE